MNKSIIGIIGVIIGACTGSAITAFAAQTPTVRHSKDHVVKAPAHGRARVIELAAGTNAWMGLLSLDPGTAVPEHRDSTEEYIHVLAGGGTLTIDGQAHTLGPGDTVYMPANATVSYQNGPSEFRSVQVFAGPAPAAKYTNWSSIPQKP